MAVAVIDHGRVKYVQAYGARNAAGDPLATNTVMYGASLTKTVFAYTVMQLVDSGKLNLDTPIKDDLDKPLANLWARPGLPRQIRPLQRPCRRSALAKDHPAHVPRPLHRLQQLLVHRTRPEAAHPLRPWHPLQLLRRRHHPAAVRRRTRTRRAGAGRRPRRPDQGHLRPPGHDPHQPDLAQRRRPERGRRLERQGRAAAARQAQQGAHGRLDEHDHQRPVEIRRRPGARRRPRARRRAPR